MFFELKSFQNIEFGVKNKVSNAKTTGVVPVIGSEATLWAPLGLGN